MNNRERRDIIERAKMSGYQGSYVDLFRQAELNPGSDPRDLFTAITPQEQEQGLRPLHEAGRTDASMTFPNVPPHTPFNTIGMKRPIDIKKYDKQGHLVKSYENVPPGLTNLDTGPNEGTVLETPARMQKGGYKEMEDGNLLFTDNKGIEYVVSPDQWAGRVYDNGRPAVYYPEDISAEQDERNFQSLIRNTEKRKEWEEGGRQGKPPFRFDYSLRPRRPESSELDKSLKPTMSVVSKQGRKPELIMKSNPQMKTGQEPDYYKVWDNKRKQWSTRPVEPEELDRYRNKNEIKQSGGPVKEQVGPRVPIQDEPIRSTESMNLDNDSTYNTRGWLAAGAPGGIDPGDGEFHGASVDPNTGMWLKSKEHSTAWKEHLGAQLSPDQFFKENMSVVNPEGYFGDNQLQYVPRKKQQTGGYNPGEYMNEMQPKVFPNQKRDAQWVKYTTDHDFAGRFPGETKSNRELGLEISNRNTVPLPPTPTVPKELRVKAQKGKSVDTDSPKENKPNKPNQGVINTQNTLRYRTKTNLPANGIWSDEWEEVYTDYLDSQNNTLFSNTNTQLFPNVVPGGLSTLFGDILYNQTGINIGRTWSPKEKAAIDEIAKRNLAKGKYVIEYGDYNTGTRYGDVGGGEFVGTTIMKSYDPAYNMKTTLGQAQIGTAPEWGQREEDTIVFDNYDFNDGRDENILNPMAWGRVASDALSGGVYGGLRSMGRQFGTPGGGGKQGRDITIVTNRKKGGPRRRAQYGDFVTGRERYEPYQTASDNTGVSMPPPPVFIPQPLNLTEEEKEEQQLMEKAERRQQFGVYAEPQGIKPMAFGPVEAILLGGAALSTGALSSTFGAVGSAASTAMNAPLLGSTPGVSSVTAGNLMKAGFGVHGAMSITGMGEGPGLNEVLTGTGRARNYNTADKAGYVGMRALELAPFGKNAMNLAEFGATQAGVGLGADVAYSGLGLQNARTKLAKAMNDARLAAMESRFVQSDFYNTLRPSYMGRPAFKDRFNYYIGRNPDGGLFSPYRVERFGESRARSLARTLSQNAGDVQASSRVFPTARQLVYSDEAPLYEEMVQEIGATQRAFKGYYSDPQNIDRFMRRYRDHVMGLSKFGAGLAQDYHAMGKGYSDPMKSLLGEVQYQLQGMRNTKLGGSAMSRWLGQPASFNYKPQGLSIYNKRTPGVSKGSNQDLAEKLIQDTEQIFTSPLSGDAGAIQRGLLDLTRSRMGFQAANADPMTLLTPREAFYGIGLAGQRFGGVSLPYMLPTSAGPAKHIVVGARNRLGLTDMMGRYNEHRRMAGVGAHENWHSLFNTRPSYGGIGINHLKPELERTVGATLPAVYKADDPTIYLRTLDEMGANISQSRIPSYMQGYPESAILRRSLHENPYLDIEVKTGNRLFGPADQPGYSTPWTLDPKFRVMDGSKQIVEKQRRLDELMKIIPGIGGIGVGLHLQNKK